MEYDNNLGYKVVIKSHYPKKVREAFRGGRNEAFQVGKFENVSMVDINSLYPYVMSIMKFPDLKTEKYIVKPSITLFNEIRKTGILGVVECEIEAPNIDLGYLPIRFQGMQMYPTNRTLKGTWTILEIERALELGYKLNYINWMVTYNENEINPFENYIKELYEMRLNAEGNFKSVIKLLMNNLYGKFSQYRNEKDYKIVLRHEVQSYIDDGYEVTCSMGNKYIISKEGELYQPSYTNAIISILITAYARDYLYNQLKKIPKEDLLYCDTDSVMFKGNYLDKFKQGNQMGEFKIELNNVECKILGEKRYYIHDRVKISGL
jgi:hypothetical protein